VYRNYKGFFSIVLMALVDADYKFLWIDVSSDGSSNDASIYKVVVGHCITSAANSALMASQTSLMMREMVFGATLKL
jgi:hypothetical protein